MEYKTELIERTHVVVTLGGMKFGIDMTGNRAVLLEKDLINAVGSKVHGVKYDEASGKVDVYNTIDSTHFLKRSGSLQVSNEIMDQFELKNGQMMDDRGTIWSFLDAVMRSENQEEQYVCPKCREELSCMTTIDWWVDPITGELGAPTRDNFISCSHCDWNQDNLEDDESELKIVDAIINLNLENNTL